MRTRAVPCSLVVFLLLQTPFVLGSTARAQSGPRETPPRVAERIRAAHAAGDQETLKRLAARDAPDPWNVVEQLVSRGDRDAALAFARAAPRPDTARLEEYASSDRSQGTEASRTASLRAWAAINAGDTATGLSILDEALSGASGVMAVQLLSSRAMVHRRMGRHDAFGTAILECADAAEKIGWLRAAAGSVDLAAGTAFGREEYATARDLWKRRLALEEKRENRDGVAQTLLRIGIAHDRLGDGEKAVPYYERVVVLNEKSGNRDELAVTLANLGQVLTRTGKYERALACHERALALFRELGQPGRTVVALEYIGDVHEAACSFDEALRWYRQAVEMRQTAGDWAEVARLFQQMGYVHQRSGTFRDALDHQERARKILLALGDRSGAANALANIGLIHQNLGEYRKSLDCLVEVRKAYEELGDPAGVARTLQGIACCHRNLGDMKSALESVAAATASHEKRNDREGLMDSLRETVSIHSARGSYREALALARRTADLAEELGDRTARAVALEGLAHVYRRTARFPEALDALRRAIEIFEETRNRKGRLRCSVNIALVHSQRSDFGSALAFCGEAERLATELGDRTGLASALGAHGEVLLGLGDLPAARAHHEKALAIRTELRDEVGASSETGNIGVVLGAMGEFRPALEHLERAMAESKRFERKDAVATLHGNIGGVHLNLGDYPRALASQERALELYEELDDDHGVAFVLGNLGITHQFLGDDASALRCYERAIALSEGLEDLSTVATNLVNMGSLHQARKEHDRARACIERALGICVDLGDRDGEAYALGSLGLACLARGEIDPALRYQERALELGRKLGALDVEARTLGRIARLRLQRGELGAALRCGEQALAAARAIGLRETVAGSLSGLARTHLAGGEHAEALRCVRSAIRELGALAGGLAEEQGLGVRERYRELFEIGIRSAWALGDADQASFVLESGRAGSLLEFLGGRERLRGFLVSDEVRAELAKARGAESAASRLLSHALSVGDRAEAGARRKALDEAREVVRELIQRIQREAKASADVLYPEADSLALIRSRIREGEALVLYALIEPSAVALVVTASAARLVTLGETARIEAECGRLHHGAGRNVRGLERPGEQPTTDVGKAAASELARLVVAPLGLGPETRRVLVSPDGSLSYVPFCLLLGDREVVHVPSGTTYGALAPERAKRGNGVLALGDPDYRRKVDPRAAAAYQRGRRLARLPATGEEVRSIGDVLLLRGDATEAALVAAVEKRDRWRAVHLACHGQIDAERPTYSSLALTPDPENDGFLTCLEVFRMRIPADLVVLSACETARGKIYRTEGILGLTRAFMMAGAPRVLCSLWKVDDRATKALMVRFYELWNPEEGKGLPAAAALRQAQEFVRSHERWEHPYYWAAWVLWGLPD